MRAPALLALVLATALGGCAQRGAPAPAAPAARNAAPLADGAALEQVLATARSSRRPALIYLQTSWCGYCRMLERETLPDPRVRQHLSAFTFVRYDADRGAGADLARRYGVRGFPTLVRLDDSGAKVAEYSGYNPPDAFIAGIPRP